MKTEERIEAVEDWLTDNATIQMDVLSFIVKYFKEMMDEIIKMKDRVRKIEKMVGKSK